MYRSISLVEQSRGDGAGQRDALPRRHAVAAVVVAVVVVVVHGLR
jgi:hypothetical protein